MEVSKLDPLLQVVGLRPGRTFEFRMSVAPPAEPGVSPRLIHSTSLPSSTISLSTPPAPPEVRNCFIYFSAFEAADVHILFRPLNCTSGIQAPTMHLKALNPNEIEATINSVATTEGEAADLASLYLFLTRSGSSLFYIFDFDRHRAPCSNHRHPFCRDARLKRSARMPAAYRRSFVCCVFLD